MPVVTGLCSWLRARPRGTCPIPLQVRYDDPEVRTFKLNAERQNGRAAMMGITGCLIHELLGVDALYPTGGLGGAAPPPIISALAVSGRSSQVQMFSEGDIGVLPPLGVYDPLGLIETRDMRPSEMFFSMNLL